MIAVIGDIHSNYVALEKVLKEIKNEEVEEIFCLGDLIGYAPFPNKIFPILRDPEKNIVTLKGNYDESVALDKLECGCNYINPESNRLGKISMDWTVKHTSKENKNWMMNLPDELRFEIKGRKTVMIHGHQQNIGERLKDDTPDRLFLETLKEYDADILFVAHSHIPIHKKIEEKHVINPGSVGRPRIGDPRASYALISIGEDVKVEFRLVEYDTEKFACEIEESDMPENNFAIVIRSGYWEM